MTTSPNWGVPYVAASQAQPEVTHNDALNMLQAVLGGAKALQNAPPGGPAEGDLYIVGTAGSGAWAGHNNELAIYLGGGWVFIPGFDSNGSQIAMGAAHEGLRVWRQDKDAGYVWTGAAWLSEGGAMESFAKASLPTAAGPTRLIYVTDEVGGAIPAFNDGVNWRRVTDRAVVS